MSKYLTDAAQKWGAYIGGALGIALSIWGINDAKQPNYTIDSGTIHSLYQASRNWEGYMVPEDLGGRLNGLLLAGTGLLMVGGAVAVASAEPARLVHEADKAPFSGESQPIRLPSAQETRQTLITRIQALLSHTPELRELIGTNILIITGGMGSGKSSCATAIAGLRELLFDYCTLVLDPDLDQNLEDQRWLCGDLWGSATHHGEFKLIWERLKPQFYAVRGKSERKQTTIFDEFSKYSTELGIAIEEAKSFTAYLKQKVRKMGQRPILILHNPNAHMIDESDLWGMSQANIKSILSQAAVLEIEGGVDAWGQPTSTGKARFKKPGMPHLTKNYQQWAMPSILLPYVLAKETHQLFEHAGIQPNFDNGSLIDPEVQRLMGQMFNLKDPRNVERLNRLVEQPTVPSVDATENIHSVDWSTIPNASQVIRFISYLLNRGSKFVTQQGDFFVNKLAENWGKNNGFSRPDFRAFIETMNHFGLGHYTDDDQTRWRLTCDPTTLPDMDD